MNNENSQETAVNELPTMPGLTKAMLGPEPSVYSQCSAFTQNNMNALSKYVAFGVGFGGIVFGASISKFAFHNNPVSYLFTLPMAGATYWLIDRSVAMAHSKKAKKKKVADETLPHEKPTNYTPYIRVGVATVFAIFNGLLIDTYIMAPDIEAALKKETTEKQLVLQSTADSVKGTIQVNKERLLSNIHAGEQTIRERNNELISEAEGLGYTHRQGLGTIYRAKEAAFEQERKEFQHEKVLIANEIAKDDSAIIATDIECKHQKALVHSQISNGFIHQFEVLYDIIMQHTHSMFLAALFYFICIVIELIPLLGAHLIDIKEYYRLAKKMQKAHAVKASEENKNLAKQTVYRLGLENSRIMRLAYFHHAQQTLQHTCGHHEEVLKTITPHIEVVTAIEAEMQQQFPNHFEEHLKSMFARVFEKFNQNEVAAQTYIPLSEEVPKASIGDGQVHIKNKLQSPR
jgi:Domain of unknown function (DUF4407)